MNKQEYLEKLESCLKHRLSREEIDDIMRDYAEYFEEGRRQSKPDSEISAKLGNPELVAQQLIEESQEQQNDYAAARGQEKKKPWGNAKEYFQEVKTKFKSWDQGEGREKNFEENIDSHKEFSACNTEQLENKKKRLSFTNDKEKKSKANNENLFVRAVKSVVRAIRWCVYAAIAAILLVCVVGVSLIWLGATTFALGALVFTFAAFVFALCVCILGIIASGLGFTFYQSWGAAILATSIAGIGFSSLVSIFLYRAIQKFWNFSKREGEKVANLCMRALRKVESWLIISDKPISKENTQDKKAEDDVIKDNVSVEEDFIAEQKVLPTALPIQTEEQGKEGF